MGKVGISVEHGRYRPGPETALASLFAGMAEALRDHPALAAVLPDGASAEVAVVLGSRAQADMWGVPRTALGFHAVASRPRAGKDGERVFEVCDRLEVHVNVSANAGTLSRDWDRTPPGDRVHGLWSSLVTLPHEILHALEWAAQTGGLSPLEVFDGALPRFGAGEDALMRVAWAISARLGDGVKADGGLMEDGIEARARDISDAVACPGLAEIAETAWTDLKEPEPAAAPRR